MDAAGSRIMNMVVRGVVRSWTRMERGFNQLMVSLLADDPPQVHHLMPYGFASTPPEGADALVFQPSGNADHLVAIVAGRGPDLDAGETAVWNAFGWAVKLLESEIRVDKDGGEPRIKITSSLIHLGDGSLVDLDGVLTGRAIDPFTGATHFVLGNASAYVRAKK